MRKSFMTEKHYDEVRELNNELQKFGSGISFYMHLIPANQTEYDKLIELANESIETQNPNLIDEYYEVDKEAIY